MYSIITLATLLASTSALALPNPSSTTSFVDLPSPVPSSKAPEYEAVADQLFNFAITSQSPEYNNTFVVATGAGEKYSVAEISITTDETKASGFYFASEEGVDTLYSCTKTDGCLAAAFPPGRRMGQYFKPMHFEDAEGDLELGLDSNGFLTREDKKDVWFACTGVADRSGRQYTALQLVIASNPFDDRFPCRKIDIQKVVKA